VATISDPPKSHGTINVGIGWKLSSFTGWGVYGLNLTLALLDDGRFRPCPLLEPENLYPDPIQAARLAPIMEEAKKYRGQNHLPFPVFNPFGNDFTGLDQFTGAYNAGFGFIENTHFSETGLQKARRMNVLVAGSTWNGQLLSLLNVAPVIVSLQGIDPRLFHPVAAPKVFPERFLIFSGGKLEYRKGQDLVIAAFREFQKRHKDAMLVFAWHNLWPNTAREIATSSLVVGLPAQDSGGRWDFRNWLLQNGLLPDSFIDIGLVSNHLIPYVLRQADVGLFPNRCEGGTNLIAMETMACGVPCILSDDCLILKQQGPCRPTPAFPGVEGWGESSVDEILGHLEWAYSHRKDLSEMGKSTAKRMSGFTWTNQVRKLLEQLRL
jgi:glycosyltransferase involved in cell wall biosynthesis